MSVRCDDCRRLFRPNERTPRGCHYCMAATIKDLTSRLASIRHIARNSMIQWEGDAGSAVIVLADLRRPLRGRR